MRRKRALNRTGPWVESQCEELLGLLNRDVLGIVLKFLGFAELRIKEG